RGVRGMPILSFPCQDMGPLVEIEVGWSRSRLQALRRSLRPIPPPVRIDALIDTGSDTTCLDTTVVAQLGLPYGSMMLANLPALRRLSLAIEHDAGVRILQPSGNPAEDFILTDLVILELELGRVGYQALLGRDVLAHCDFLYQGPAGRFQLTY